MTSSGIRKRSTSPARPLKRGKACLTCRFLKIRCDGARPVCGPCHRTPKDDPCEYADGPGRSRTRALEETISRLQARLREYEHPNETPPVALHHPYDQDHESDTTVHIKNDGPSSYSKTSPPSPFSSTSSLSRISTPHPGTSEPSDRAASISPAIERKLPPLPATTKLLEWFFIHASSFGFFLNISRFSTSALLPLNFGHQSRPSPGLLSTVYLLGIHLSPEVQPKDLESLLLMKALRDTALDLSSSNPHPYRVLHTIQAETLLGYYFFRNGNILEAKRHSSSAASLALECRLNTFRSSRQSPAALADGLNGLPASKNIVEEGERINGFWAVFTLYRNISVAVDPSGSVCGVFDAPGCQIDTPWPLDMESYKQDILPPRGSSTVHDFLNHIQQREDEHQLASITNLITKASLLLHQASFVAGQYYSDMPARDAQAFFAAFQSLRHLIDTHRARLSPLEKLDSRDQSTRDLFLAHALVHGSIIRLNEIFSESDPNCRQSCLAAAQTILHGGGLNIAEFGCVNPIMGTLWALACQTLIKELARLRSAQSWSSPHSAATQNMSHPYHIQRGQEEGLLASIRLGLSALTFFSANSALMSESFTSNLSTSTYEHSRSLIRDRCIDIDMYPMLEDKDTWNIQRLESLTWPPSSCSDLGQPASIPTSMALGAGFNWDNLHTFEDKFDSHETSPSAFSTESIDLPDYGGNSCRYEHFAGSHVGQYVTITS